VAALSRLVLPLLVALLVVGAVAPAAASAQQDALLPTAAPPERPDEPPQGFLLSPNEAERITDRLGEVRELREEHQRIAAEVLIPTYRNTYGHWYEVIYADGEDVLADIYLNGRTGKVVRVWTGPQAATPLARGEEPSVGRSMNKPYIWLPLAVLFVLPFFDPKRPFRLLHLDLLVLLGFGLSQIFFNKGQVEISVPLVYPFLVYLLVRLLCAGFRPRSARDELIPYARLSWLVVGLVGLVAFRVVLNAVDSGVIDVGFASVIGADRIMHGEELYVFNEIHGDTYGPINYLAYIPFELIFPTDGTWGSVPAAHAAAITFDLLVIVGLTLLGTRLRPGAEGRKLGIALAFAWAAYPFTLLALQANTNDALVAALTVGALLALRSPPGRGLMLGLAAAAKFAPAALVPLLATGTGEEERRTAWPQFAAAFAGIVALTIFLYLPAGGLREFWDATLGFQMSRYSPFSPWGLEPSLQPLQDFLKVAAIGLAAVLAFVPRRRDLRQVAALAGAVTIAVQLPATHWFYFYLVWIAPLALIACMGAYATAPRRVAAGRMD
jgi:Glycosyltransferase family 87